MKRTIKICSFILATVILLCALTACKAGKKPDTVAGDLAVYQDGLNLPANILPLNPDEPGDAKSLTYAYLLADYQYTYSRIAVGKLGETPRVVYSAPETCNLKRMYAANNQVIFVERGLIEDNTTPYTVKVYDLATDKVTDIQTDRIQDTENRLFEYWCYLYEGYAYWAFHDYDKSVTTIYEYHLATGEKKELASLPFYTNNITFDHPLTFMRVSGQYLLYNVVSAEGQSIVVYDLKTHTQKESVKMPAEIAVILNADFDAEKNLFALYYYGLDSTGVPSLESVGKYDNINKTMQTIFVSDGNTILYDDHLTLQDHYICFNTMYLGTDAGQANTDKGEDNTDKGIDIRNYIGSVYNYENNTQQDFKTAFNTELRNGRVYNLLFDTNLGAGTVHYAENDPDMAPAA